MSAIQQVLLATAASAIDFVAADSTYTQLTTVTTPAPAGLQEGDFLIFFHTVGNTARTVSSGPSGATLQFTDTTAPPSVMGVRIYTKVATAAEPADYSVTLNIGARQILSVLAYRGATALDTIGTLQYDSGTSTATAPSITPTASGCLIALFAAEAVTSDTIATPPSGMDQRVAELAGDQQQQAIYELNPQAASATGTKVLVWTSGVSNTSMLVQIS